MTLKSIPVAVALALAAGCAAIPVATDSVEQARAAYAAARENPQVARNAPAELDLAGRTLNEAERLSREGADAQLVEHVAYIATQRAHTARELGLARAAEAQLADATEIRNRVLMQARAREAQAAHERAATQAREAEQARMQAEQARSEAEQARSQAEQAREEAQRAERERQAALQAKQERDAQLQAQRDREEQLRAEVARFESELRELRAQPTERGWVLTLGNELLFDVGQATLKPGGRRSIEQVAQLMKRHPERNIVVEGFTDSTGDAALNERLSRERADAVRRALIEAGVEPPRITARGLGEAFPVASNDTPAGRQLNRRVQVVVLPEASAAAGGR